MKRELKAESADQCISRCRSVEESFPMKRELKDVAVTGGYLVAPLLKSPSR